MAKSGIKITTIKREVKPEDVGRKAIFPYSVNDAEDFAKLQNNRVSLTEIKQPRNVGHHRKVWALARMLVRNGHFSTERQAIDWMLLKAGAIVVIEQTEDKIYFRPKSIAFENMDEIEFSEIDNENLKESVAEKLGCTVEDINENRIFYM